MDYHAWGKEDVKDFMETVAPPGEVLEGFDDRILFDDAVELARDLGDDGLILLAALKAEAL